MKKTLISLVAAAVAFCAVAADPLPDGGPYKETVDGITWTFMVANGEASVGGRDYSSPAVPTVTKGAITIPSSLGDRLVKSVGELAFNSCSGLTSVTMPEGVTSIGMRAFSFCSGLTSVMIPEGVTSIGNYAFSACSKIKSVSLPSSITNISDNAFSFCSGLTSVTVPEGVTSIGGYAFYCCGALTSVSIPASVTSVGDMAFSDCYAITSATLPGWNCGITSLKTVVISEGTETIKSSAFAYCNDMTNISITTSVTNMGAQAFKNCSKLNYIDFEGAPPEGVASASIKTDAAIRYNVAYEAQWLPVIEQCGWTNVQRYYPTPLSDGGPYRETVDGIEWTFGVQGGIACIGYGWQHQAVSDDVSGEITIPAEIGERVVTQLSVGAFYKCKKLTSVGIPSTVTNIEEGAFEHCNGLLSIELPNGLWSIGDYGFHDCSSLKTIEISASVKTVGSCAFQGCTNLTTVGLASGVTNIGSYAFKACDSLSRLTIPSSVVSIGEKAFLDCTKLNSVDFEGVPPEGVSAASIKTDAAIRYYAAYEAQWLPVIQQCGWTNAMPFPSKSDGGPYTEKVDGIEWTFMVTNGEASVGASNASAIPQSTVGPVAVPTTLGGCPVTRIGGSAFWDCRQLKGVTIPEGVTSIGSCAFYCTDAITELDIPASVTNIEEGAFYACFALKDIHAAAGNQNYVSIDGVLYTQDGTSLVCCPAAKTSVSLLTSVTNICAMGFGECRELESIELPPNLATLGGLAFYTCHKVPKLVFPSSVIRVGRNMFPWCRLMDTYFEGRPPENIYYVDFVVRLGPEEPDHIITIYYNVAYVKEWQALIKERGLTNAKPYDPEVQPIESGGEIVVPEGKAEEKADEINDNPTIKAAYLKAPEGVETTEEYLEYFDAVATSGTTVAFVLNNEGTNAVVEATEVVKAAALNVVLSDDLTFAIDKPLAGFYYSLKQGGDISVGDKADLNKLGGRDTISFELTKNPRQYFYKTLITPTPL